MNKLGPCIKLFNGKLETQARLHLFDPLQFKAQT